MQRSLAVIGKTITPDVKADPVVNTALAALNSLHTAFTNAGFTDTQLRNALVQDYMESGAFTNSGWKQNNPGNIMYTKNDQWATKGTYDGPNKTYFAAYKNLDDYAQAKKRVLSLDPGRPIDATGTEYADFAHRLKLNNYYGDESEASYLAKLNGAAQRLRILGDLDVDSAQNITTNAGVKPWYSFFTDMPVLGKVGIVVGGLIVLKILFDD
jgi:hypothetical protein